jgi:hypothetical protein
MPNPDLLSGLLTELGTAGFLAGIVGNFVADMGYDLSKAGLRPLGDRIANIFGEGGEFRNHDLLRALRYAECQAVVAVCSTCLLEDYDTSPSLTRAFVEGPILHIANTEVRQIAAIRRQYDRLSRKAVEMAQAELESQMASQLKDVEKLVGSAREICNAETVDELRERTTLIVRQTLVATATPDLLTRAQRKVGNLFKRENDADAEHAIPPKLLERIDRHWFDMFRLAFREVLKDDKFSRARRAFEIDVLSKLSDSSLHDLSRIEARLDERDKKLDHAVSILKQIEATVGKAPRARGRNLDSLFARQQKEFRLALAGYQNEVLNRLEAIAGSQDRIAEQVSTSGLRVTSLLVVVLLVTLLVAGVLIYGLTRPPALSPVDKSEPAVAAAEPETSYLRLLVEDRQGDVVSGASVEIDALPGKVFHTTTYGDLSIEKIPRKLGDQVRIKVTKGNLSVEEYVVLPGPKTISLN